MYDVCCVVCFCAVYVSWLVMCNPSEAWASNMLLRNWSNSYDVDNSNIAVVGVMC